MHSPGAWRHSALTTPLLCPVMRHSSSQLVAAVAPCPAHGKGGSHSCSPQPLDSCISPPPPLTALPLPMSTSTSMAQVLARQFCQVQSSCAKSTPQGSLPPSVSGRGIFTPPRAEAWERALADHPHKEWVSALLQGMRQGFRIGLHSSARCRSSAVSRPSARAHSQVVDEPCSSRWPLGS